jgi:hypothetical protein
MKKLPSLGGRALAYQVGIHQDDWEGNGLDKLDKPSKTAVTYPRVVVQCQHHAGEHLSPTARLLAFLVGQPVQEDTLGYNCKPIGG